MPRERKGGSQSVRDTKKDREREQDIKNATECERGPKRAKNQERERD